MCNILSFFFSDNATTQILPYVDTLSLHVALPLSQVSVTVSNFGHNAACPGYPPEVSLNTIVMWTGVLLLLVSFWKRNDIPGNIAFHASIDQQIGRAHV